MEKLKGKDDITLRFGHFEMRVKGTVAISFSVIAVLMVLMSILVIQIPEYHDKRFDFYSIFSSLTAMFAAIVAYLFGKVNRTSDHDEHSEK
jgi:hypothetical protein